MENWGVGDAVRDALAGGADVVELGQESGHQETIVEEIRDWREFLRLRAGWDELAAGDADGALLGHDWMAQAWKCGQELRGGEAARILGWRDPQRGAWRALLALRHNPRTRRLCFLEERRLQRLDLLAQSRPGAWTQAGEYLRRCRDWDRLDLLWLREASAQEVLATWPGLGLKVRVRGRARQRYVRLDCPWEEVEAGFSPYLRANLRRRLRRLQSLGAVTLTVHAGTAGLGALVRECFALEQRGWKGKQGTSIQDDAGQRRFYRQLAFRLAGRGNFRLYCLRLAGRLIAFEFCVADPRARRLHSLKIAYDEDLRTSSPGTVLRWRMLPQAAAEFDRYEFLGEDAAWKADWTAQTVELFHLRAFNRTLGGYGWLWRAQLWAGVKKVVGGRKKVVGNR